MKSNKRSGLSKLLIFLGFLFVIILALVITYYSSFYPKTDVKQLNSTIVIDKGYMIKKFLPDKFNLSLKEIFVESDASFNQDEITDFFILAFNEIPELKENVTGLKAKIENDTINLYINFKYKGLPVEAKLIFTGESIDGKGVFHYKEGNVGFLNISKDRIFSNLQDTSIVQFDKDNGNVILSFEGIKQLDIKDVTIKNNEINFVFRGTLKFYNFSFK